MSQLTTIFNLKNSAFPEVVDVERISLLVRHFELFDNSQP